MQMQKEALTRHHKCQEKLWKKLKETKSQYIYFGVNRQEESVFLFPYFNEQFKLRWPLQYFWMSKITEIWIRYKRVKVICKNSPVFLIQLPRINNSVTGAIPGVIYQGKFTSQIVMAGPTVCFIFLMTCLPMKNQMENVFSLFANLIGHCNVRLYSKR